jgi:CcmD family protein
VKIDLTFPQPTSSARAPTPAPTSAAPSADDRSTAFRPVEGGTEMQSGEKLLVEAYAAIWIILFAFVLISWRRQRRIDERVASLEAAVEAARREEAAAKGGT